MKKMMFIALAILTLGLGSCSKEAQINRKLDGSWTAVTYDGNAVQSGTSFDITFSKDKGDNGTGNSVLTGAFGSYAESFTYVLVGDKLTTTPTSGNTDAETVTINTFEKDKIQWTDSESKITVLQPK